MFNHPANVLRDVIRYFRNMTPKVRLGMIDALKIQFSHEARKSLIDWITEHGVIDGKLNRNTTNYEWSLDSEDFSIVDVVSAKGDCTEEDIHGFTAYA